MRVNTTLHLTVCCGSRYIYFYGRLCCSRWNRTGAPL